MCELFGIPTPKNDIDGSQVASVYYKENNLERIKNIVKKMCVIDRGIQKVRFLKLFSIQLKDFLIILLKI